jgi:O-acetyl-ADP-ribose deacetylase (regulator of RNase III)
MKIEKMNILDVENGYIVHSCNCLGGMGGLAGAIASKYPIVKTEYLKLLKSERDKYGDTYRLLGHTQYVDVAKDLTVVNLFGQYDTGMDGRKTEYSALVDGFKALAYYLTYGAIPDRTIYIPFKIGCGLGGGDWNIVKDMINWIFTDSESVKFNVIICDFN